MSAETYVVRSSWRHLVPAAIAFGLVGAALGGGPGRWLCIGGTIVVALLWLAGRARRPVLHVDDEGYRVTAGKREVLSVRFADVKQARAQAAESAMYVDAGAPTKNLLLPPRRGYGFRFADQERLYARLAEKLSDKIELVEKLEPKP